MTGYDAVVVGGGVSGTSLLYAMARYSTADDLLLVEKEDELAALNSDGLGNSQTLHAGDIETNYGREKAAETRDAAELVVGYGEDVAGSDNILHPMQKMVLGVGADEKTALEERYDRINDLYPALEPIGRDELEQVEPAVVRGRDEETELFALYNPDGYAVDYGRLSESFADQAERDGADVVLDTVVEQIVDDGKRFTVETDDGTYRANAVAVAAGTHSLSFAHDMGYGEDLTLLPVAGSFYYGPDLLDGKVYTVQNPKLPFAAIHGDRDVIAEQTRFGPTAKVVPMLERGRYGTVRGFADVFSPDRGVMDVFTDLVSDPEIRRFMAKNAVYDVPAVGRYAFLKEARKVVPGLSYTDIAYADGVGGIRPQVVDTAAGELVMGEAKERGDGILFNMTPSPGATNCLKNAYDDAHTLSEFLDIDFDADRFLADHQP